MNNFFGTRVIIVNSLYETIPQTVNRTWKERLFTFPWRPLQTTKTVYTQKPAAYSYGGVIYAHPSLAAQVNSMLSLRDDAPTLKIKVR
jgi:hypothetical protein